jgi:hypothetical protein
MSAVAAWFASPTNAWTSFVVCRELAQPRLVPRVQRPADATASVRRIDEPDELVDAAVDLVVPPDAAVGDRDAVDLCDEQVALGVAAVEVVVRRRNRLRRLDPVVSLAARRRGDDASEVGVVGGTPEHPEVDAVEPGKCRH